MGWYSSLQMGTVMVMFITSRETVMLSFTPMLFMIRNDALFRLLVARCKALYMSALLTTIKWSSSILTFLGVEEVVGVTLYHELRAILILPLFPFQALVVIPVLRASAIPADNITIDFSSPSNFPLYAGCS